MTITELTIGNHVQRWKIEGQTGQLLSVSRKDQIPEAMQTTHQFSRGNRKCLNCGLMEDFVEFMPSCPAGKVVASAVVEREYGLEVMGMEVRSDIPLPKGVAAIVLSRSPFDPEFNAQRDAVIVRENGA